MFREKEQSWDTSGLAWSRYHPWSLGTYAAHGQVRTDTLLMWVVATKWVSLHRHWVRVTGFPVSLEHGVMTSHTEVSCVVCVLCRAQSSRWLRSKWRMDF